MSIGEWLLLRAAGLLGVATGPDLFEGAFGLVVAVWQFLR